MGQVKELIYRCYSNLAMAHYCINNNIQEYNRIAFAIRAKLYKGLCEGSMHIHSLFDDEKIKLENGNCCVYCKSTENLSIDHIFPRHLGGTDTSDNLVCACKSCNSSKNTKELLQWFIERNEFPPLMILRRYLKLIYLYCEQNEILCANLEDIDDSQFPFRLKNLSISFPQPKELRLL